MHCWVVDQRHSGDSCKHLRWKPLQQQLTAFSRFVNTKYKRLHLAGVLRRYRTPEILGNPENLQNDTKSLEKSLINVNHGINSLTEFSNSKHELAPKEFHLNNYILLHIKLMHIKLRCILLRKSSMIIVNALSLEWKTR